MRVRIRCRVLVVQHPVVRNDASIELAHQTLPDVVDAVLVVQFVQFRDTLLLILRFREVIHVMILPDVMQAVKLVGSNRGGNVSPSRLGRKLCAPVWVLHLFNVFFGRSDHPPYMSWLARTGENASRLHETRTLHYIIPRRLNFWCWWAFKRSLVP
jgi:hypothetical protein